MRTKCAISDAFGTRSSEIAFLRTVLVWLSTCIPYQLNKNAIRLCKNAISDERVRDCALCTHSVARPLSAIRLHCETVVALVANHTF